MSPLYTYNCKTCGKIFSLYEIFMNENLIKYDILLVYYASEKYNCNKDKNICGLLKSKISYEIKGNYKGKDITIISLENRDIKEEEVKVENNVLYMINRYTGYLFLKQTEKYYEITMQFKEFIINYKINEFVHKRNVVIKKKSDKINLNDFLKLKD